MAHTDGSIGFHGTRQGKEPLVWRLEHLMGNLDIVELPHRLVLGRGASQRSSSHVARSTNSCGAPNLSDRARSCFIPLVGRFITRLDAALVKCCTSRLPSPASTWLMHFSRSRALLLRPLLSPSLRALLVARHVQAGCASLWCRGALSCML